MIALLNGVLAYKSTDHVIVDVQGVGYRLHIPLSTFYSLPDQGSVRLHVYTHVREDAIQLYGFLSLEERELFLLLLSVSGVGPKLALNILSHSAVAALREAIAGSDSKRLATLPGIGKKTAERLVLELRDKVGVGSGKPGHMLTTRHTTPATTAHDDALSALINLGYKESLARKAIETLELHGDTALEEILRGALKILMR